MTDNDNAVAVHDNVNHPVHYQGSVECIDAIMSATEGLDGDEAFLVGSVIKYIWRYRKKGKPVEDLKKALPQARRSRQGSYPGRDIRQSFKAQG